MSQIGEGKATIESLGRLLGNADGKAGRLAAGLGGSTGREEFARLMASAQGRFKADGEGGLSRGAAAAPESLAAAEQGVGGRGGDLEQALAGLADQLAQLRDALAGRSQGLAQSGENTATEMAGDIQSALDELAGLLDGRGGRLNGAPADGRALGQRDGSGNHLSITADGDWRGGDGGIDGLAGGSSEPAGGGRDDLMAGLGDQLNELADALTQLRQSTDNAGSPSSQAWQGLAERLAALREGLADAQSESGAMPAGLLGQLQALEQVVRRAESAASGEARGAQGLAASQGEAHTSWDGFLRFAENGRRSAGSSESTRLVGGAGGEAARDADWTGGPVSAALGLTGREPSQTQRERAPLTHWSSLNGLEGRQARSEAELASGNAQTTSAGLGASAASMSSGGSPAGGIFTGQAAAGTPNPQMPAQLGQQVQWMVGKGISKASIELRPADLGPLKIAIETQGDETRIALTASNATAQGLLEQQLPRLKEWLQEAGLANSEVEVDLGQESDFGQQLADADDEGQGGAGGQAGDGTQAGQTAMMGADGTDGLDEESTQGRLVLDLFA
ncbi:flagellar hook-length control protein FliK [Guyparkeria halophila]|uniref:Flagellar hook-length control protein FliK n=1 Tax=Guyparkeria halophila TaxID=47960 RepID=A0ABZ0YXE9_9GAMM|nr:flagellar hook-length control protein FliK [Guyparkeria halophila]WQH15977.1 flagellar hook-length control protein FliK [Guyparkeria halophila]